MKKETTFKIGMGVMAFGTFLISLIGISGFVYRNGSFVLLVLSMTVLFFALIFGLLAATVKITE